MDRASSEKPIITNNNYPNNTPQPTQTTGGTVQISGNELDVNFAGQTQGRRSVRTLRQEIENKLNNSKTTSHASTRQPPSQSIYDHTIKCNSDFRVRFNLNNLEQLKLSDRDCTSFEHQDDDLAEEYLLGDVDPGMFERHSKEEKKLSAVKTESDPIDQQTGHQTYSQSTVSTPETIQHSPSAKNTDESENLSPKKMVKLLKDIVNRQITKAISKHISKRINSKHGLAECAREFSKAIVDDNVNSFKEALQQVEDFADSHNNKNRSGLISYHEQLEHLHVNDKPLLYALAESGSAMLVNELCQNSKMRPRAFYTLPVFKDRSLDEYITDRTHDGELNRSGWWCYPKSPVCFALESGNIDTAVAFIENGGSIKDSKRLLKNLPTKHLNKISDALDNQKKNIMNQIKDSDPDDIEFIKDPKQNDKFNKSRLRITAIAKQVEQHREDFDLLNTIINQDI